MTLTILSANQFQTFCEQVTSKSFIQSVEMAEFFSKRGYKTQFLGLEIDNDIKIAALVYHIPVFGGNYMELYFGPISSDDSFLTTFYQGLQQFAKNHNVVELNIKPFQHYQTFNDSGEANDNEEATIVTTLTELGFQHEGLKKDFLYWHYVKDLSHLTSDQLMQSYSKKGKPLVKKALTFGIELRRLQRHELELFKSITAATSDRREFDDKPISYYEQFYDSWGDSAEFMLASLNFKEYHDRLQTQQDALNQKIQKLQDDLALQPNSEKKQNQLRELSSQSQTFDVRKAEALAFIEKYGDNSVPLAASLFVYTPQESVYFFSGSFPEFNKFYAPAVLQHYAMEESIKRGISTYNLLGITGHFDGSDSILKFKQNFNGYVVQKAGSFHYYPKPLKYKLIQMIKKVLRR